MIILGMFSKQAFVIKLLAFFQIGTNYAGKVENKLQVVIQLELGKTPKNCIQTSGRYPMTLQGVHVQDPLTVEFIIIRHYPNPG